MSTYSLCFSPTGRTKKVLNVLGEVLNVNKNLDLFDKNSEIPVFAKNDICLIAVPSFGGRGPKFVVKKIRQIKSDEAKAIIISSYGNRDFDDTLLELKNEVEKIGFSVVGAIAAVTEHSIMRQFGAGRPDKADVAELKDFAEKIKQILLDLPKNNIEVPGKIPYVEYNGVPFKILTSKKCNNCNLCVKECPLGAISAEKPRKTDNSKCITCLHCVHICLQNARHLNKLMLTIASKKMKKVCQGRKANKLFI